MELVVTKRSEHQVDDVVPRRETLDLRAVHTRCAVEVARNVAHRSSRDSWLAVDDGHNVQVRNALPVGHDILGHRMDQQEGDVESVTNSGIDLVEEGVVRARFADYSVSIEK